MASVNELIRDEMIAKAILGERYSRSVVEKFLKTLSDYDKVLSSELREMLENNGGLTGDNFTQKRIEALLKSVRDMQKDAFDAIFKELGEEMGELAGYESKYFTDMFGNVLPPFVVNRMSLTRVTKNEVLALSRSRPFRGRLLSEWASKIQADRLKTIQNSIFNGRMLGYTDDQIIRSIFGTVKQRRKDGSIFKHRRDCAVVVKQYINHVQNVAFDEVAKKNSDLIEGKQWLSTLDTHTTPICISRDGKIYTIDNKPVGHNLPAMGGAGNAHFGCRSFWTFIVKRFDKLGFNISEMPKGERASMDGQIPEDITYLEWAKKQPVDRLVDILGITRAKLVDKGELTLAQLFDPKTGLMLTLKDLAALYGK